ncbi:helix-turn-helix domain-containing protein [Arenibaculum sp.]|jgi:AcrR family transcriptional regulator|uniref:TetR/AcrR family transcriptional regulator n=1 Tax=Arenibaculum sp. TaxID=2865862 RepID=UPI002E103B3D|nr:helix-turn-helix domain-containing protein [Arenibaculum sp.]
MGTSGEATRRHIVETAYELFYGRGYARVGVDAVAEAAGVTKRTLYYHFRSKDDLLAAAVERHHELALERIAHWAERLDGDAPAMVDALFAELARWAARPDWRGAGFTRLVMELADLPGHPARAIARRHKAAVEARLAAELARRGVAGEQALARELMLLLEGCLLLVLVHGDRSYAETAAGAARRLLAG